MLSRRSGLVAALLLLCALLPSYRAPLPLPVALAQAEGRYYPQTGHTLAAQFVSFYDSRGGIPLFGYPVSEAHIEGGYLVQWTERQRLEYHPENAGTEYEVLLGLLGRELTRGLSGPRFQAQSSASSSGSNNYTPGGQQTSYFFTETGHSVSEPFLSYWQNNGGVRVFGFPISEAYADSTGMQIQWFERARFEQHTEISQNAVLLGHLGLESLKGAGTPYYEVEVHDTPAPDNAPRLELSQGGESPDPAFLQNVRQPASALGPALVRLDNVFSFYGIVQRGADGAISYHWDRFDQVIDSVRAMGMEPLLCLSYMPETMSISGQSRTEPPKAYAEWADLVRATVTHLNVERKLGIRYFEVWNEPDQGAFWHAPFDDYLQLYDTTVQAAVSVDPSVRIGGPGLSRFSAEHVEVFLKHEASLGDKGRVDFLSWHEYGQTEVDLAAHIRQARQLVTEYPQFKPELYVTEFNVLQGGLGDTSAGGYSDKVQGAIALLSSVESMARERLDKAFLFELKDGQGPSPYWGRWGILTFDAKPKPVYYALEAFEQRPAGALPITLKQGSPDGTVGLLAYGGPARSSIFLWYAGATPARVKLDMPPTFASDTFDLTLFDATHNNPAMTGDPSLKLWQSLSAGDLRLDLKPNSLVIITSH